MNGYWAAITGSAMRCAFTSGVAVGFAQLPQPEPQPGDFLPNHVRQLLYARYAPAAAIVAITAMS